MQDTAEHFKQCSLHNFSVFFMHGPHHSVEHLACCSSECTCTHTGREAVAELRQLSLAFDVY